MGSWSAGLAMWDLSISATQALPILGQAQMWRGLQRSKLSESDQEQHDSPESYPEWL